MTFQVQATKLLLFVIMFRNVGVIEGMEYNPAQKMESKCRLHYTRPCESPRANGCGSLIPETDQVALQYQYGKSLIQSLVKPEVAVFDLKPLIDKLTLQDRQEIIKAAEHYNFDWILRTACDSYAQSLTSDTVMQSLFKDNAFAQAALEISPGAQSCIVKNLNGSFKKVLERLFLVSQRTAHRLYTLSPDRKERQDTVIMQTGSSDVLCIRRDFFRNQAVIPLIAMGLDNKYTHELDQSRMAAYVEKAQQQAATKNKCTYFDGRAYLLSQDGSFILGFTGNDQHDIDTIALLNRTPDENFECVKAFHLESGILAHRYILDKHESVKNIPLCTVLYDIQKSFAIHPYERVAAYIDDKHTTHLIDFTTGQVRPLCMDGNALAIAWSPNGNLIASSTTDGRLRIRSYPDNLVVKVWNYGNPIHKILWSGDGSKILLMNDKTIGLINVDFGFFLSSYNSNQQIIQATLSDDATRILLATEDGTIHFWDGLSADCIHTLTLDNAKVIALQLSPDACHASITCEQNGNVILYLWHIQTGVCVSYNEISENSFSALCGQLISGRASLEKLSLPQMILAVAAAKSQERNLFSLSSSHYLASHLAALVPELKKIIEGKIFVKQ